MNTALLKAAMAKNHDTQTQLSTALSLSLSRLNAKINETAGAGFTQHEIAAMVKRYHLTNDEAMAIFFPSPVS